MIFIKNYLFSKKDKKRRQVHNQNRTIILFFKKAVLYILSIQKYDIRYWRQVEFKNYIFILLVF